MAKAMGLSYPAFMARVYRAGIRLRPKWHYRTQADWDAAFAKYDTFTECARAHGTSRGSMHAQLAHLGIVHPYVNNMPKLAGIETAELVGMLERCDGRPWRVARMLGVNVKTVIEEMGRRGIERTHDLLASIFDDVSTEELREVYRTRGSKGHYAFGCAKSVYYKHLRKRGIR